MNTANKIKTFLVGAATFLLTACGGKNTPEKEPEIGRQNAEWTDGMQLLSKGFFRDVFMKSDLNRDEFEMPESKKASKIIDDFLTKNNVAKVKGDSVLKSFECDFEGNISNVKYAANPDIVQSVPEEEIIDTPNGEVKVKHSDKIRQLKTKLLKAETVGIAKIDWIEDEPEVTESPILKGEAAKKLKKGDVVSYTQNGEHYELVVEKDGVSPMIEDEYVMGMDRFAVFLNYQKNQEKVK